MFSFVLGCALPFCEAWEVELEGKRLWEGVFEPTDSFLVGVRMCGDILGSRRELRIPMNISLRARAFVLLGACRSDVWERLDCF